MRKILIFITTLLILQGCSFRSTYSTDQIQNLVNSIKIDSYKNASFDTSSNSLTIELGKELITKEDFDKELDSLVIGDFLGSSYTTQSSNSDDITISLVSTNNNSLNFKVKDKTKEYNIQTTKYSTEYTKTRLNSFSANLVSFDEVAGSIETDLAAGRDLGNKKENFDKVASALADDFTFVKTLSSTTSELADIDNIASRFSNIETLVDEVATSVNSAVVNNNSSYISVQFLKINDIDKFARSLQNI